MCSVALSADECFAASGATELTEDDSKRQYTDPCIIANATLE